MASVTARISPRTGAVSYRVRFRVDNVQRQESFEDPVGAHEFADLVDRVGGAAALKVLARRRAKLEATPTLRQFTATYLDKTSGLLTGIEDGTREGYRRSADLSFLKVLGELPIDAIERDESAGGWHGRRRSRRRGARVSWWRRRRCGTTTRCCRACSRRPSRRSSGPTTRRSRCG